jgi:hypothetical protein
MSEACPKCGSGPHVNNVVAVTFLCGSVRFHGDNEGVFSPVRACSEIQTLRDTLKAADAMVQQMAEEQAAELERLRAENDRLQQDANRYRYIRDTHTAISPHMGGNHSYRFRCGINGRGNTFDEAIDNEMILSQKGGE